MTRLSIPIELVNYVIYLLFALQSYHYIFLEFIYAYGQHFVTRHHT